MECIKTQNMLSSYLDGDLSDREQEEIAGHIRQCSRCAEEERALRETLSLLRNLPAEAAPPELLEGVTLRIAEKTVVPLWKKLFLPVHIKIPLEAAAVVLVFLLVYGIQKEMPSMQAPSSPPAKEMVVAKAPPPPPAAVEKEKPVTGADIQVERRKTDVSPRLPVDVADWKVEAEKAAVEPREEAPFETEQARTPAPLPVKPPLLAKSEIPVGLASRVSTGGGTIEPAVPQESPAKEAPEPSGVGAQLSRLERPSPYGKEVTVEVARNDRMGMEDRITELALRLGGGVRGGGMFTAISPMEINILHKILQVSIPADSEDEFLKELGKMGTIHSEEMLGKSDTYSVSSSGTVVYTVRIHVR
ncbi:MAG: zf-HC2 domain-containing protein [Candidatus Deferrimicrobiaceae bacterium]